VLLFVPNGRSCPCDTRTLVETHAAMVVVRTDGGQGEQNADDVARAIALAVAKGDS